MLNEIDPTQLRELLRPSEECEDGRAKESSLFRFVGRSGYTKKALLSFLNRQDEINRSLVQAVITLERQASAERESHAKTLTTLRGKLGNTSRDHAHQLGVLTGDLLNLKLESIETRNDLESATKTIKNDLESVSKSFHSNLESAAINLNNDLESASKSFRSDLKQVSEVLEELDRYRRDNQGIPSEIDRVSEEIKKLRDAINQEVHDRMRLAQVLVQYLSTFSYEIGKLAVRIVNLEKNSQHS